MDKKRKFIKAKAKGMTNKAAALEVNPELTDKSAEVVGSRLANLPDVKQAIQKTAAQALEDAGLGIDDFIETIREARTATKVIVMGKGSDDSFVDIIPDWSARLKATEMGLKLLQAYTVKPPAEQIPKITAPELVEAVQRGDIKALERIVFNEKA